MRRLGLIVLMCMAATMVASTVVAQKPLTPTQLYLEYRAVYEKAKSIEAIFPFIEEEEKAKLKALPKAQATQMWDMMKAMDNFTNVKVLTKTIKGETCVLEVEATKPDKSVVKGTVELAKKTSWLVVQENWSM